MLTYCICVWFHLYNSNYADFWIVGQSTCTEVRAVPIEYYYRISIWYQPRNKSIGDCGSLYNTAGVAQLPHYSPDCYSLTNITGCSFMNSPHCRLSHVKTSPVTSDSRRYRLIFKAEVLASCQRWKSSTGTTLACLKTWQINNKNDKVLHFASRGHCAKSERAALPAQVVPKIVRRWWFVSEH